MTNKLILDACCGSRMFHFDKDNSDVLYMDNRELETTLCDGRTLSVKPDIVADFRSMPFDDNSFHMIIFDPPHLVKVGDNSWLAQKYGKLDDLWPIDIKQGFEECIRVLKPHGTLVFKWNEEQISKSEILNVIGYKPIVLNQRSKTHWMVFMKGVS